jgi:hypothetical protein
MLILKIKALHRDRVLSMTVSIKGDNFLIPIKKLVFINRHVVHLLWGKNFILT